jgi:dienelactone hydrolase
MSWISTLFARRASCVAAAALLWAPPAALSTDFTTVKFPSADGLLVTADLYEAGDKSSPVMVLFHQSRSSRGEYRQIAPELVKQGFNALAVDLRWGGRDPWNKVVNETSARNETEAIIASEDRDRRLAALLASEADMLAALRWLRANGFTGPLVVWGSSFSAMLVYQLAAENPDLVAAVVAYSPGEYDERNPDRVRGWARRVTQPVYVACGTGREEKELAQPIYDAVSPPKKTFFVASKGNHGASILLDDPANWNSVKTFLTGLNLS